MSRVALPLLLVALVAVAPASAFPYAPASCKGPGISNTPAVMRVIRKDAYMLFGDGTPGSYTGPIAHGKAYRGNGGYKLEVIGAGNPGATVTVNVVGKPYLGFIIHSLTPGAVFTGFNQTTTQWLLCDINEKYALAEPSTVPTGTIGHTGSVVDSNGIAIPVNITAQLQLPTVVRSNVHLQWFIVKQIKLNPYVHGYDGKDRSIWYGPFWTSINMRNKRSSGRRRAVQ